MHGGSGWDGAGGAHPVADTVTAISTALDAVVDCPLYGLGPEATGGLLAEVVALESRLAALRLRLLCAAELAGTAESAGAPNTAAWLRANTRTDRVVAGRAVKLGRALGGEFTLTGDALAAGRVSEEQARVIVRAVQALPSSVDSADRRQGEAHLIEQAAVFDPVELARLGRRLLEVIAPDEAGRLLGEQLAREQARAGRRELFIRPDGSGGARLSGRLDPEGAALLDAALDPLARSRPSDQDGPDPRTVPQRHADALVELARRALAGQCCAGGGLPETGGEAATLLITLSLDALRTGLGPRRPHHPGRPRRRVDAAGCGPGPPAVHPGPGPLTCSASQPTRSACSRACSRRFPGSVTSTTSHGEAGPHPARLGGLHLLARG